MARLLRKGRSMSATESDRTEPKLTLWLDPVCPFSWNTARWLHAVAEKAGWAIDWRLMSLAVLNEGRELPPPSGPGCATHNRSAG